MKTPIFAGAALLSLVGGAVAAGCGAGSAGELNCGGAEALRTCAKGATVRGMDVSSYQGNIDWAKVKTSGRTFAFARVSDGTRFPDSKFAQNWGGMKKNGITRGAYQFFRPGQSPAAQAKILIDRIKGAGGLGPGDLPPVLDIEVTDGQSPSLVQSRAKTWLSTVEKAVGIKPIVYTANFMSSAIGTALKTYPLWVANYGAVCPLMPTGWSNWQFWQNSDNGQVPGISGGVDTNLFNGTLPQLRALSVKGTTTADGGLADAGTKDAGTGHDAGTTQDPGADDAGTNPDPGTDDADAGSDMEDPDAGSLASDGAEGATLGSANDPSTKPPSNTCSE